MKCFLIIIGLLVYFLLDWFSNSLKAETITTNNLVSTNFRDGSWNNPVNSFHDDQTLAGQNNIEHTTSVTYSTDIDALNQNGFTMNGGATIWHWYSNQTVYINQSVTLDNGSVINQVKTYNGARGLTQSVSNSIVVNPVASANYVLGLGINFADTRGAGHYSADVSNPFITLTYDTTVVPPLDETTLQNIQDINEVVKVKVPEQKIEIQKIEPVKTEPVKQEPIKIEPVKQEPVAPKEEIKVEEKREEPKPEIKEEPKKEQAKVEKKKPATVVKNKEKKESDSKDVKASSAPTKESKEPKAVQQKEVKTGAVKVDSQIKDIGRDMKLTNLAVIKAMTDNAMISAYSIPFYKNKKIYNNQLSIADTKLIYASNNLDRYISNDPVVKYQNTLRNIRLKKQQLINEIKQLKKG
tara:strand:+ start:217 stop:1446 length:1230 start_codon:yes stop_codon:yes gene_type:complete